MKFKIWNKKDDIKGFSAQYYINDLKILDSDGVFLILDDYGNVTNIQIDRIIKSVYKLDADLTTEQVAEEYIKIKEKNEFNGSESINPNEIDVIKGKIDILQTENKQLKEASKEQDKLLVDNTYKISMLEMNLGGM